MLKRPKKNILRFRLEKKDPVGRTWKGKILEKRINWDIH